MTNRNKPKTHILFASLPALACVISLVLAVWGAIQLPYQADSGLLAYSWTAQEALATSPDQLARFWKDATFYPPAYSLLLGVTHYFLGRSVFNVLLLNLAFIALCACAVYGLAKESGSIHSGAAALILIVAAPIVPIFARSTGREIAMMAMVTCSLWALARSEFLRFRYYSILAGIFIGAGMMFKWTFLIYLAFPCAALAVVAAKDNVGGRKMRFVNGSLLTIALLLVCGPWYFGPADIAYILGSSKNDPTPWVWKNLPLFGHGIWLSIFGWATLLSLVPILRSWRDYPNRIILVSAFVGSLIFLAIIPHKEIRYAFALIPIMAVMIAWGLTDFIKRPAIHYAALGAVIATSTVFGVVSIAVNPRVPGITGDLIPVYDRSCLFVARDFNERLSKSIALENPDSLELTSVLWNGMDTGNDWLSPDRLDMAARASGRNVLRYILTEPMYYEFFAQRYGKINYLLTSESLMRIEPKIPRRELEPFTNIKEWLSDPGYVRRIPIDYELLTRIEMPCAGTYLLFRLRDKGGQAIQ